jgi:fructosamine-3-kinase
MEPQPTWREAFRIMYNKLLDDIVACDVYDKPTADNARALLDARIHVFDACVKSHLCHGDLWVTNLLVEPNGRVTGVLDFDRACWGDIEWDLAIAEYCGVTNRAFCEGYGRVVETGAVHAAVRRLFYLLYEHQKYIVISMSSRRSDPAHARRYAKESLGMMEQLR